MTKMVPLLYLSEIGAEDERGKNIQSKTDDFGIFF